MEIVENIALISLNETLIVQLVSFLIFLYLINRIMIRPLQQTMGKRQEYITSTETEIHQLAVKLKDLSSELTQNESKAIADANAQRDELKSEGSLEAESLLEESRNQIYEIRKENREMLQQEVEEARQYIDSEAEGLAVAIMETILDRGVSRG